MPEMTEVDKPAVAETKPEQSASSTESDTDDEIPELEDAGAGAAGAAAFPGAAAAGLPIDMVSKAKQSRGEKKARKIMSKLGLKPVSHACLNFFLILLNFRYCNCLLTGLFLVLLKSSYNGDFSVFFLIVVVLACYFHIMMILTCYFVIMVILACFFL